MDITPLVKSDINIIQSYKDGVFKISGRKYEEAVLVAPFEITQLPFSSVENLKPSDFDMFEEMKNDVDVILFGTGTTQEFFSPEIMKSLDARGIHIDVMDTGAACRTYNVLITEGRRVVAALMPVA